jgi:hypothetical protein
MEQIHILQSEIASSRTAEAQLRVDILELRTIISVLDAVVCQRAENTPTGEEDSARKKKNKSTKKRSTLMRKRCVGRRIPRRSEAGVPRPAC